MRPKHTHTEINKTIQTTKIKQNGQRNMGNTQASEKLSSE